MSQHTSQLSRRRFLAAMSGLVGLGATGTLSGCGLSPIQSVPGMGGDRSDRERYLNLSLYPDYIDGAPDGPFVTLDRFQRQSGIHVQLYQDMNDVGDYMDALSARFEVGLPSPTDVMIMPDEMIYRFNRAGWLQRLDAAAMAPAYRAMNPVLYSSKADQMRRHSIPWAAGATAIAYDSAVIKGGVNTFDQLLTDPALRGRVGVFASMLSSVPPLACGYGTTAAELAPAAVNRAIKATAKAAQEGQFARAYDQLDYIDDFRSGKVLAGLALSGDIINLRQSLPNLVFHVPSAGSQLWVDSLVVPKGSPHRGNAQDLMKFYYEPRNAAELAAYLKCMCPVPAAKEVLAQTNPTLAESRLIFPNPEDLTNLKMLRLIRTDELAQWGQAWDEALSGVPR